MDEFEQLLQSQTGVKVIAPAVSYSSYVLLDLSVSNIILAEINPKNAAEFENYVTNHLKINQAIIAYGGYNETRNLYKTSSLFKPASVEERNIHIGLDLWTVAGQPVLAALDGKIHSFQYNNQLGDYGPTIILQHQLEGYSFYTLYGHLSLESIQNLSKGQSVTKRQIIATLGDARVNGGYAPHLHFQIIKNIQNKAGDYPGVCSATNLSFYLSNCPNPNLLLKINS